jgi:hypothetical protein
MSGLLHNNKSGVVNQSRIAGYLDTLLIDHSLWDEKLSLATNPPVRPLDTIAAGKILLVTGNLGCGTRSQQYIHCLNGLSIVRQLPISRLRTHILQYCFPLAAEA